MKTQPGLISLAVGFVLILGACGPSPTASPPTESTESPTQAPTPRTKQVSTPVATPTETPVPVGQTLIVSNVDDSGAGSFRHALLVAKPGDIVKFDPAVFPTDSPATIALLSPINILTQGHITIDASEAGVLLDGSAVRGDSKAAIEINSNHNVVRGLHALHFPGPGLVISGGHDNLLEGNVVGENWHGMGLWGTTATNNQFRGNFVGVEADGVTPQGNAGAGLFAWEGAHGNLFGPGNVSAFNQGSGVEINGSGSLGNQIFENSIYNNGIAGIGLPSGGNENLAAPRLMDFDPDAGLVSGMACGGCKVLIYSDEHDQGSSYEGVTTADASGMFSFNKGAPFAGPALTATSTDELGNTSPFSVPAFGAARMMQLQVGNAAARVPVVTRPSEELDANGIGGLWSGLWGTDFADTIENVIVPQGLKYVRLAINENEYISTGAGSAPIDWSRPEMSIPPAMDAFVPELRSHQITVAYVLTFWDKENHPQGWQVKPRFKTEEEISRYLDYLRFIVGHYRGQVQYYELWNEPHMPDPLQYIEPADYITVAKLAIPLIHEIDPLAKVTVGAAVTNNPRGRDYLFKILNSDVMPVADAVSWHPFYGNAPGAGAHPEYYAQYPSLLQQIMNTAADHGFTGEYIADELTFSGPGCQGCAEEEASFSELAAAKYTARVIILHRGNDVIAGVGDIDSNRPIHYRTVQYLANVLAGASAESFEVQIETEAPNVKVFTFTRSDGSKLAAIWNDDPAVDEDPGVRSSVIIPGFGEWSAVGMDTINGFQQELNTADENGSLVIRDLLLKDYPTIIRLSK